MKAAVLHEFKQPLTVQEVAEPKPEAGEVLIAAEACGVCHSDLHPADGDSTQLAGIFKKPLIPGHEIVGRVVEKGAAVRELRIGDRVGVPWIQALVGCGRVGVVRGYEENLYTGGWFRASTCWCKEKSSTVKSIETEGNRVRRLPAVFVFWT